MVVTSALTGALLAVHFTARAFTPRTLGATHPAGWLLLPFVVYAAANVMFVSPVRWLGWVDWFWWAQMIAVFWVVLNGIRSRVPRRVIFVSLVALGIVGVGLGSYQSFLNLDWLMLGRVQSEQFRGRASGSFGIPNSLAAFLLLVFPAGAVLALRGGASATERAWWGWVSAVLVFGLILTISRGAWIALGLALVAWPLFAGRWKWRRRLTLAVVALSAVLVCGVIIGTTAPDVRERFASLIEEAGEKSRPIAWGAAWRLFRDEPVWGTGAGSYNVLFEKYRPERFPDEPQWAHNEFLNTLSDYGAAGFTLFFGACGIIAVQCLRRRRAERTTRDWLDAPPMTAALAVGVLAFGIQLTVDFHFKISALAMAFATVAALVVGRAWPARESSSITRAPTPAVCVAFGLGAAVAVALVFVPMFRAEALRYRARESLDQLALAPPGEVGFRARVSQARIDLASAVSINPANARAWSDLAYATALWGLVETGRDAEWGRQAEAAAGRALALAGVCHEFWIRRGVARDMQGQWLEAGNDFTRAVALAPNSAFAWYHYAEHMSRNPTGHALAQAALAFCLRLDPWNPSALALRQRMAISPELP